MKRFTTLLACASLVVAAGASAATFNLFQPAAGVLKGNPSTYVTTAAAASDIISLWSGTCNSTTFLRGDGSCAATGGGGGGTVTSISAGDGIEITPTDPITSTGTVNVDEAFTFNWTGVHTFDAAYTNFTQDDIDHTGLAGFWRFHQDASNWYVQQCDSLNSTCLSKLTFSATGNDTALGSGGDTVITSGSGSIEITGGNVDITTAGQLRADVNGSGTPINVCLQDGTNCPAGGGDATLAGTQTFTGVNTFAPASGSGVVYSNATSPSFRLFSSGAAADQKHTTIRLNSVGSLFLGESSADAAPDTLLQAAIVAQRTGTAWSAILFGNTTNNPTFTWRGTGSWSVGGSVGTSGQALISSGAGAAPVWGSVALGSAVSGTLPVANGGTGTTTSTGTGNVVLSASPTLTGTVTAATVAATAVTGDGSGLTALNAGNVSSGTLPVARGGTGTTTSTGSGSVVLSTSPTFSGTVSGGTFAGTHTGDGSGLTNLDAGDIAAGTLPVARGGTGVTSSTGTGNVVLSASPTLTGTVAAASITSTPSAAVGVTINTAANNWGQRIIGNATTGQSFGMLIDAGTNSSDDALRVRNAANTDLFRVQGDGNVYAALGFNPDTNLGADLGTSSLRFTNIFGSRLCDGVCATTEMLTNSSTTVVVAGGSAYTDISLTKNSTVSTASSPSLRINDTSGSTFSAVRFLDNGAELGAVGSNNAAGQCITGDSAGDVCIRTASGAIRVSTDGGATGASVRDASNLFNTGTLPVARGGTGTTTSTGTGNVVLSASPTLTGTTTAATIAATAVTVGGQNVCQANGTNCPSGVVAYGAFTVSGTTCTLLTTRPSLNISSCSTVATAISTINFTVSAGAGNPACVATIGPSPVGPSFISVHTVDADSTSVRTYASDSNPGDRPFTLYCIFN